MYNYWLDFVEYMNSIDAIYELYKDLIDEMRMDGLVMNGRTGPCIIMKKDYIDYDYGRLEVNGS